MAAILFLAALTLIMLKLLGVLTAAWVIILVPAFVWLGLRVFTFFIAGAVFRAFKKASGW